MSMKGKNNNSADFLTVDEAAQLVGLSHWTIRKYMHDAKLQRYVSGSRIVVSRSELLELLKPVRVRPAKPSARQGAATRTAAPIPQKEQTK
jgi:excisionase family DNA binding protein